MFPPEAIIPIGDDGNIFPRQDPTPNITSFPQGVIGTPGRDEKIFSVDMSVFYTGFRNHRLRFGLGAKHGDLIPRATQNFGPGALEGTETIVDGTLTNITGPDNYMLDESRQLWFSTVQDEWSFSEKWELTAGVRYDMYSDFGGTINPRLAMVWEPRFDLTTKLLYGTAFRPPSFQELHTRNNPSSTGNPDLDPETINTIELAFDYQPMETLRTIFNVYAYEIKGYIELVPTPTGRSMFQNAWDQEGYGVEFETDWDATDTVRLRGNVAFQVSKDKETDEDIPNTPGMQGFLNAHWVFLPDWAFDAQVDWIADRKRDVDDDREQIDDIILVGLIII